VDIILGGALLTKLRGQVGKKKKGKTSTNEEVDLIS
jgi:hypothetical protein